MAAPTFIPYPSTDTLPSPVTGQGQNFHRFSPQNGLASSRGPGQPTRHFVMTQTPSLSLAFAAATDIGCVRANNEDTFGYDLEQQLYVVCDGMGGSAAGEVASRMAVRTLIEFFELQAVEAASGGPKLAVEARLSRSIKEANRVVREAAAANPAFSAMGTTLVCACLDGSRVVLGNVGDSRAYLSSQQRVRADHPRPFAA